MFLLEVVSSQLVYKLTLVVLTAIVILTLASQFGQYLYLELTTHFRLQYVLAAIACALVLTAFQSWKFLPIAILCAVLNAVYLAPYFRSDSRPPADSRGSHLRVLHANVLKNNTNYQAVIALTNESNADIVVLQEITDDWKERTKVLEGKYPYFEIVPLAEGAGMAVFSRYPFADIQVLTLDASTHVAILAKVKMNQQTVTVLTLHPPTPVTPAKFKNRNRQFREAAALLNSINGPKILIGDLNTTMWSPFFTSLLHSSGMGDARLGFGLETSWPMPLPSFLRLAIDHCLVSGDVRVDRFQMGRNIGSDHRPLIVDLTL